MQIVFQYLRIEWPSWYTEEIQLKFLFSNFVCVSQTSNQLGTISSLLDESRFSYKNSQFEKNLGPELNNIVLQT